MRFGAHVSVAGGYEKTLEYLVSLDAECAQVFAKSPRQWQGPRPDPDAAARFVAGMEERFPHPLFTHTAYLINLATPEPILRERSIHALADELSRASLLRADGVVTHVGTAPDGDIPAAARRVGEAVIAAFDLAGDIWSGTRLLLENTAGGGTTFGCDLAQLARSIDHAGLPVERLGVCLDTCHAFAFGFPLDTEQGWREIVDEIDSRLGLDRLGLIHANDCLFERGSRRDRHAWIGEGFIGNAGFSAMVCVPEFANLCAVTEMPGEPPEKDEVNLARLKRLRADCGG